MNATRSYTARMKKSTTSNKEHKNRDVILEGLEKKKYVIRARHLLRLRVSGLMGKIVVESDVVRTNYT